jgi:peptidoglycan/xylan/chitin deacetylase (PgdA/CDA1 family)
MKLVSPILKHVAYPLLSSSGYFRQRARDGRLCVITYHGVRPAGYVSPDPTLDGSLVTTEKLRRQIRLLKANYSVISPQDLLDQFAHGTPLPERAVLLTCDDGLLNTVTEMLPVLVEEGVGCLFFVLGASASSIPGMLWYEELKLMLSEVPSSPLVIRNGVSQWTWGANMSRHAFWWNLVRDMSKLDQQSRAVTLQHIRQSLGLKDGWIDRYRQDESSFRRFFLVTPKDMLHLLAEGMTIGAHTLTHPLLSQVAEAAARNEIAGSRDVLEGAISRPVLAFAYPFGNPEAVTQRDVALAEDAGFCCAFLNVGGGFGADLPRFALPRVHVTAEMGLGEFEAHVSGFYRSLRGPSVALSASNRASA